MRVLMCLFTSATFASFRKLVHCSSCLFLSVSVCVYVHACGRLYEYAYGCTCARACVYVLVLSKRVCVDPQS